MLMLKKTSQIVRNDLTTLQQYNLTQRVIGSRKLKEICTVAEGRGRKLKSEEYPELNLALEYAFGELDTKGWWRSRISSSFNNRNSILGGWAMLYHNATSQRNPSLYGSSRVHHIAEFVLQLY